MDPASRMVTGQSVVPLTVQARTSAAHSPGLNGLSRLFREHNEHEQAL